MVILGPEPKFLDSDCTLTFTVSQSPGAEIRTVPSAVAGLDGSALPVIGRTNLADCQGQSHRLGTARTVD